MSYLKAVAILALVLGIWVATERAWRAMFGDGEGRLSCGGCGGCGNRCSGSGLEKKET